MRELVEHVLHRATDLGWWDPIGWEPSAEGQQVINASDADDATTDAVLFAGAWDAIKSTGGLTPALEPIRHRLLNPVGVSVLAKWKVPSTSTPA